MSLLLLVVFIWFLCDLMWTFPIAAVIVLPMAAVFLFGSKIGKRDAEPPRWSR